MRYPLLKVTAGFSVLIGIILFCVVFGGYSSFMRAQSRVEKTDVLLLDGCQKRLDLLPSLIEFAQSALPGAGSDLQTRMENASRILTETRSVSLPRHMGLTKQFEMSQADLTRELNQVLVQLEKSLETETARQFFPLKQAFHSTQDSLFVIKKSYNSEVLYFNTRKSQFPGFLIARFFGFDTLTYQPLPEDLFLPAAKTFNNPSA